jgi:hypothetical protein
MLRFVHLRWFKRIMLLALACLFLFAVLHRKITVFYVEEIVSSNRLEARKAYLNWTSDDVFSGFGKEACYFWGDEAKTLPWRYSVPHCNDEDVPDHTAVIVVIRYQVCFLLKNNRVVGYCFCTIPHQAGVLPK